MYVLHQWDFARRRRRWWCPIGKRLLGFDPLGLILPFLKIRNELSNSASPSSNLSPNIFDQKGNIPLHEVSIANSRCRSKKRGNGCIKSKSDEFDHIVVLLGRLTSIVNVTISLTGSLPPMISLRRISTSSLLVRPLDNSFHRSAPPSTIGAHRSHFGLHASDFISTATGSSTSESMSPDRFHAG